MSNHNPTAVFPQKLEPLFTTSRYKSIRGGRGSGKSWGVARALLIIGAQNQERILCCREYQNSIQESVHKLLADQIDALGLSNFYEVQKTTITGRNGTTFSFAGLHHNINSIKSMEGLTKVWCEEAQTISKESWSILIPTVFRRDNSEIWLTWNPVLEEDETYRLFVTEPQPGTVDVEINWSDNPWFPQGLAPERDHLRETDYNAYLNIWEGQCRQVVDGAFWTMQQIAALRDPAPQNENERQALISTFKRIVVAVDPSGCSGKDDERSDEIGIVVAGLGRDDIGRILEDRSGRHSPDGWGAEAIRLYDRWRADRIVAESNYGGAMVEHTIRTARPNAPITLVQASRGKTVRAEPIAALYEQGKCRHVGYFPELERQMCLFSASGYKGPRSPDRADAGIWALTDLMVDGPGTATVKPLRL